MLAAAGITTDVRQGKHRYVTLASRQVAELIDAAWNLTDAGSAWAVANHLGALDPRGKPCMDSIERRLHLTGPLGVALCIKLFERGWITRIGESRAVRLTATGRERLWDVLEA